MKPGLTALNGWARVAQVRKRRSGRETSRPARGQVEVRGFSSHAQTSAGKWPAPGPGLGDERASRGRPGHPARGRSSGAAPGSRGLGGWGLLARCGKRRPGRSPAPAGAAPGCAPLFRAPARTSRPLGAEPSRGSPKARRARRRPGPGAGPRGPAGLPGRAQGPASAPRRRTTRERGGPASHPAPRPPARPYLAPGTGASSSRGRRGPARAEGRDGDRGSRGRRPARLPRFRRSQELNIPPLCPAPMRKTVTATAPPTSERGTAGPPCPRPSRPAPGRSSDARASRAWGGARASGACTPRGTIRPRALQLTRQPADAWGGAHRWPLALSWGARREGRVPLGPFVPSHLFNKLPPILVNSVLINKHFM